MAPSNVNVLSALIPGSVWARQTKKGTTQSRVIAVSNAGLSAEVLEQFPQQVVFVTEKQKILTQDIETFLANRSFVGSDDQLETLVAAILNPSILDQEPEDENGEEKIDFDSVTISSSLNDLLKTEEAITAKKPLQVADLIEAQARESDGSFDEQGSFEDSLQSPELEIAGDNIMKPELEEAFVAYTESPFHTGDTLHTLRFVLSDQLSLTEVANAFDISREDSITSFIVNNGYEISTAVEIDGFAGAFLELNLGQPAFAVLYVTSAGHFRAVNYENNLPEKEDSVEDVEVKETNPEPALTVIEQISSPANLNVIA